MIEMGEVKLFNTNLWSLSIENGCYLKHMYLPFKVLGFKERESCAWEKWVRDIIGTICLGWFALVPRKLFCQVLSFIFQ